jgi:hypothetical protein
MQSRYLMIDKTLSPISFIKDSRHEVVSYLQENQEVLQKMQTK